MLSNIFFVLQIMFYMTMSFLLTGLILLVRGGIPTRIPTPQTHRTHLDSVNRRRRVIDERIQQASHRLASVRLRESTLDSRVHTLQGLLADAPEWVFEQETHFVRREEIAIEWEQIAIAYEMQAIWVEILAIDDNLRAIECDRGR